jgi:hypothetical protein
MFDIHVKGRDFDQFKENISPQQILYLANPPLEVLREHIEKICILYPKAHLTFLSSLVVNVYNEASRYSYVSKKAQQEKVVIDICTQHRMSFYIVRPGPILSKISEKKKFPFHTDLKDLVSVFLRKKYYDRERIIEVYTLNDTNVLEVKIYGILVKYMPFYCTRLVDLVLRNFGVKNYGYTFLLNRKLRVRR